jgi:glycosyltransferase involved in cell wall biosynthesis
MEGFGFVPAEAMACGTPAIVSDCGSLPEIVKHGETGFVLPVAGNSCAWVETMRQLVHDPQLRVRVGSNATSDVRMRFNWDRNAAAAADFMRRLVHLRGRTAS